MLRAIAIKLSRHGRRIFEGVIQKGEGVKALPRGRPGAPEQFKSEGKYPLKSQVTSNTAHSAWIQKLSGNARKTVASELRRRAAEAFQNRKISEAGRLMARAVELATGRKFLSLYALIGFSMKTGGKGIELEDEQFDNICDHIKSLMKPESRQKEEDFVKKDIDLSDLEFGSLIAKGCNSAVYSARLNPTSAAEESCEELSDSDNDISIISDELLVESVSENEQLIMEDDDFWDAESDFTILDSLVESMQLTDEELNDGVMVDCNMDLAVKMMFNYDAGSNAETIIHAMENEAVPSTQSQHDNICNHRTQGRNKTLKRHANIVEIWGMFVDDIPELPDAFLEYPDALPTRLNPDGFGHNKTLFLVMNRYGQTLREYLQSNTPSLDESMLLLTQLLEAVVHLYEEQVAHRDLKSDNILLTKTSEKPELIVSDFGCCLADKEYGLCVPYFNHYMDKGGNSTLMAPEIACASPGRGVYLDYSKADLWTVGTLAYEIFGGQNPFYHNGETGKRLDTRTYREEDLPNLPDHVPVEIQTLIKAMLNRDPAKRPRVSVAANVLHILQMAPASLISSSRKPNKLDLIRWLLTEAAGVMCQRSGVTRGGVVLYKLKEYFLARLCLDEVLQAVDFIYTNE